MEDSIRATTSEAAEHSSVTTCEYCGLLCIETTPIHKACTAAWLNGWYKGHHVGYKEGLDKAMQIIVDAKL